MKFVSMSLNGVSYGMLLFLVASGLTITFGLMRTLNLAHGAFYLLGGYLAADLGAQLGDYWLGLVAAVVLVTGLGMVFERTMLHRIPQELPQIVVTIGFAFVLGDLLLVHYGGAPRLPPPPPGLEGAAHLGSLAFPKFRLALIVMGLAVAALVGALLRWTRVGSKIRAAVDDERIAQSVGIRVPLLFMVTFGFGTALAAFAGALGGAFGGLEIGNDFRVLLLAIVVVVVGGLGSVKGAFVGALAIGLIDQYGKLFFPEFALFTIYAPVAVFLALRPQGLFGRRP